MLDGLEEVDLPALYECIHIDDDKHWNVSPTLVRLTVRHPLDKVEPKDRRMLPFTKPGMRCVVTCACSVRQQRRRLDPNPPCIPGR